MSNEQPDIPKTLEALGDQKKGMLCTACGEPTNLRLNVSVYALDGTKGQHGRNTRLTRKWDVCEAHAAEVVYRLGRTLK